VLVLLVAAALLGETARAGSPTISYPDFSSTAGLQLNGFAGQSGSALRLAPSKAFEAGSAWAEQQVSTTQSFESQFQVEVHGADYGFPADGMTFALQSQGLSALGDTGGAHGYAGSPSVSPSVGVDISLFPQLVLLQNEQFSIVENGSLTPIASAPSSVLLFGQPFTVWVDYDATAHSLQVFVSQDSTKPSTPLVAANVDLAGALGPTAYPGFTAATGALDTNFDVLDWTFQGSGSGDSTPPTVTCSAAPAVLWPPNNKLVPVTTQVSVSDSDSGPAGFTLLSVTSNEGSAASESSGWTVGSPDTSGFLQASRLGSGTGRVYTLTYQGADRAGNTATCSTTVTVPHDQGS
jgi:hypothetical protein